jgi:hypothetical protein
MPSSEATYFELLDACGQTGCAICTCLRAAVGERISREATARGFGRLLVGACAAHAGLVTIHLRSQETLLRQLLTYLRALAPSRSAQHRWRLLRRHRMTSERCALCRFVAQREPSLLRGVLSGLHETQFLRAFRAAAPICRTHETRLLAVGDAAAPFAELQQAKLALLNDRLIRHDLVSDDAAAVEAVVQYFAAEQEAARWPGGVATTERACGAAPAPVDTTPSFEVAKLWREVHDLTRRLGEAESRAASLHYRVAVLTKENRDWEMRYTGLASHARGIEADLRAARANEKDRREG